MRTVKLTEANVATLNLPASKAEDLVGDAKVPNHKVRLRRTADGQIRRTYVFTFSRRGDLKNKSPKIKIGDVGAITLAEARKIAQEHNAALAHGNDPARAKQSAQLRQAETFGALLPRYLAFARSQTRPKTYQETARYLERVARPLHALPIEKISRRDIATVKGEVAARIAARGMERRDGKVSSNRLRVKLGGFFAWAMSEGLVEHSPVVGSSVEAEPKRDRVLSPPELALIWKNAGESNYAAVVKLLMLTGARRGEIALLERAEIQDDGILLPPTRVKINREHFIPLARAARDIIDGLPHRNSDATGRVFGGFAWEQEKTNLDARIAVANGGAPLAGWVHHDLRRSFSTLANEHGIAPPHVIEACLGHALGGSGSHGRYNWASYRVERQRAMTAWANLLMTWIAGKEEREGNIARLARRA